MMRCDGWLRAVRVPAIRPRRSGNVFAQMANMLLLARAPKKVHFWYLDCYGYQFRLGKNLPKGISADMEDEWLECWANVEPWENGLGGFCRRAQKEKPSEKRNYKAETLANHMRQIARATNDPLARKMCEIALKEWEGE